MFSLTIRYPPVQPVRIMPMMRLMFAEPKMWPTAVGIVEKKLPTVMPATITKTIKGPNELAKGHMRNMLAPSKIKAVKRTFRGPRRSQRRPEPMRPRAEAALKAAVRLAPVLDDSPRELAKVGTQYGGTKRGNVPSAPTRNSSANDTDRNIFLAISVSLARRRED